MHWYVVGALWGLCDGSIGPIMPGLIATEFTDAAAAFSVFGFVKSFCTFAGFLVAA